MKIILKEIDFSDTNMIVFHWLLLEVLVYFDLIDIKLDLKYCCESVLSKEYLQKTVWIQSHL